MLKKLSAWFLLPTFILSSVTTAEAKSISPLSAPVSVSTQDLNSIAIPASLGRIEERSNPSEAPSVILIQDAHSIPDAQRSIYRLIEHFQKNYGLKNVALEGASVKLDPDFLRSYPDQKHLKTILDEYMDRGELSGVTAAAIFEQRAESKGQRAELSAPSSMPHAVFQGIEDWNLYEEGIGYYQEAAAQQAELSKAHSAESIALQKEKEKYYSKQLLKVDELEEGFRENKTDLAQVLKSLSQIQSPKKESSLHALIQEIKNADKQDYSIEIRKIAKEIEKVLSTETRVPRLEKELGTRYSVLGPFQAKKQLFQTEQISESEYAAFLKQLAAKEKIKIKFPEKLKESVRMHEKASQMEGSQLMKELDEYLSQIKSSLIRTPEEQELEQKSRELYLIGKLIKLELTREEWKEIRRTMDEKTKGRTEYLSHLNFYKNAEKREQAMLDNLQKSQNIVPRPSSSRPIVLVVGGFHTQGLAKQLKEKKISYVVVTPRINSLMVSQKGTGLDHKRDLSPSALYKAQMQGDVSWKNYFRVENGRIDLYGAFTRAVRDQLLHRAESKEQRENRNSMPYAPSPMLKQWRDQIIIHLAENERIEEASAYTKFIDEIPTGDGFRVRDLDPQWFDNIENFFSGLRKLEASHQLNSQSIAALFKPSTATVDAISAQLGHNQTVSMSRFAFSAKSELTGTTDDAETPSRAPSAPNFRGEISGWKPLQNTERDLIQWDHPGGEGPRGSDGYDARSEIRSEGASKIEIRITEVHRTAASKAQELGGNVGFLKDESTLLEKIKNVAMRDGELQPGVYGEAPVVIIINERQANGDTSFKVVYRDFSHGAPRDEVIVGGTLTTRSEVRNIISISWTLLTAALLAFGPIGCGTLAQKKEEPSRSEIIRELMTLNSRLRKPVLILEEIETYPTYILKELLAEFQWEAKKTSDVLSLLQGAEAAEGKLTSRFPNLPDPGALLDNTASVKPPKRSEVRMTVKVAEPEFMASLNSGDVVAIPSILDKNEKINWRVMAQRNGNVIVSVEHSIKGMMMRVRKAGSDLFFQNPILAEVTSKNLEFLLHRDGARDIETVIAEIAKNVNPDPNYQEILRTSKLGILGTRVERNDEDEMGGEFLALEKSLVLFFRSLRARFLLLSRFFHRSEVRQTNKRKLAAWSALTFATLFLQLSTQAQESTNSFEGLRIRTIIDASNPNEETIEVAVHLNGKINAGRHAIQVASNVTGEGAQTLAVIPVGENDDITGLVAFKKPEAPKEFWFIGPAASPATLKTASLSTSNVFYVAPGEKRTFQILVKGVPATLTLENKVTRSEVRGQRNRKSLMIQFTPDLAALLLTKDQPSKIDRILNYMRNHPTHIISMMVAGTLGFLIGSISGFNYLTTTTMVPSLFLPSIGIGILAAILSTSVVLVLGPFVNKLSSFRSPAQNLKVSKLGLWVEGIEKRLEPYFEAWETIRDYPGESLRIIFAHFAVRRLRKELPRVMLKKIPQHEEPLNVLASVSRNLARKEAPVPAGVRSDVRRVELSDAEIQTATATAIALQPGNETTLESANRLGFEIAGVLTSTESPRGAIDGFHEATLETFVGRVSSVISQKSIQGASGIENITENHEVVFALSNENVGRAKNKKTYVQSLVNALLSFINANELWSAQITIAANVDPILRDELESILQRYDINPANHGVKKSVTENGIQIFHSSLTQGPAGVQKTIMIGETDQDFDGLSFDDQTYAEGNARINHADIRTAGEIAVAAALALTKQTLELLAQNGNVYQARNEAQLHGTAALILRVLAGQAIRVSA